MGQQPRKTKDLKERGGIRRKRGIVYYAQRLGYLLLNGWEDPNSFLKEWWWGACFPTLDGHRMPPCSPACTPRACPKRAGVAPPWASPGGLPPPRTPRAWGLRPQKNDPPPKK